MRPVEYLIEARTRALGVPTYMSVSREDFLFHLHWRCGGPVTPERTRLVRSSQPLPAALSMVGGQYSVTD